MSKKNALITVLVLSTLCFAQGAGAAQAGRTKTAAAKLPSEATVQEFMKHWFGHDPSLTWRVAEIKPAEDSSLAEVVVVISSSRQPGQQVTRLFITPDGKHAVAGELIPFGADPFAAARQKLAREANGPARGPANAPVTIVEFGDLQCPSCKAAAPIIEKLLSDEPSVRFIFQQFPLPQIHKWAFQASTYADCIGRENNAVFWNFVKVVYDNQASITEANASQKLRDYAAAAGANVRAATACAASPVTAGRVDASLELGKSLDVTGTPTLFINGRKISNVGGMPYDVLKQLVEFHARQGK
jgi:protein-disulfide isomerase